MHTQEFKYKDFIWYKFQTGQPQGRTKKILYFHGGGFVMDSGLAQFQFACYLADKTGAQIWFPEYPIVPEHNGCEALEMAMYLYESMLRECKGEEIAIGGDSAGGALALSTALQIKDKGLDPAGDLFLLSPACNIIGAPRNKEEKDYEDLLNSRDRIVSTIGFPTVMEYWRGPLGKNDWRVNPMTGCLKDLPRMLVFAGGFEAMEMEIRQFVEKAIREGADITYFCKNGEGHDFLLYKDTYVEERTLIVNRLLQ